MRDWIFKKLYLWFRRRHNRATLKAGKNTFYVLDEPELLWLSSCSTTGSGQWTPDIRRAEHVDRSQAKFWIEHSDGVVLYLPEKYTELVELAHSGR